MHEKPNAAAAVGDELLVIGAGAAGLFCAARAAEGGRKVRLVDHGREAGRKILISGGGRCNFTNSGARPECYLGEDPAFCTTALSAFGPGDFLDHMRRWNLGWKEKARGQLFCEQRARALRGALVADCRRSGVRLLLDAAIEGLQPQGQGFRFRLNGRAERARQVVVATGGLSFPKLGASDFAYRLARELGLRLVERRPALVPLCLTGPLQEFSSGLSGLSLPVAIRCGDTRFGEDLLFTHRGLSGPAVLQISSYWQPGREVRIDFLPGRRLEELLGTADGSRQLLSTRLAEYLPRRFCQAFADRFSGNPRVAECRGRVLERQQGWWQDWRLKPAADEGYRKAEVTRGGMATEELDPYTMECHKVPGLYFIGEAVDITGWLGGYNFQWAWASAFLAARALSL